MIKEKTGINDFNIIIDASWYTHLGDFRASERFGGTEGLRNLIDELSERGHKVLLWLSPYAVSVKNSRLAKNHSRSLVKDKDGQVFITSAFYAIRDFTTPEMRRQIKQVIRYCLSDERNCLNASGLKLDYIYTTPDAQNHQVKNPCWGVGDELWYRALRLIYETAHKFKKDALISASGVESYLQPYVDMLRLNDNFGDNIDAWCKRARLGTILLPQTLIDVDGWFMTRRNSVEYWMVSPVFGVPVTYHLTLFDNKENLIEEDYRRLSSAWAVYLNSPIHPSMEIYIEPENNIFYRRFTSGKLAGFYSALSIDRRCLITYNERVALITATDGIKVEVPLPPWVKKIKMLQVSHQEEIKELHPAIRMQDNNCSIFINVEDSAKGTKYYRISY